MNTNELYWIAGLLEGEGSFLLKSNKYPVISCAMTDKDIIDTLKDIIGKGNIHHRKPQELHHKESWQYTLIGIDAMNLMLNLYSLMGNRRKEQINQVEVAYTQHQNEINCNQQTVESRKQAIINDYDSGLYSYRDLAKKYKVSHVTISNYIHNKNNPH